MVRPVQIRETQRKTSGRKPLQKVFVNGWSALPKEAIKLLLKDVKQEHNLVADSDELVRLIQNYDNIDITQHGYNDRTERRLGAVLRKLPAKLTYEQTLAYCRNSYRGRTPYSI